MASSERTIAKDFMALMKNIKSFSDGQAEVTKWDDKNLGNFEVTISPNDGFYKEGEFVFEISMESCDDLPRLNCKTAIYHPNIDTIQDPDGEICINLFDPDMWNQDCSMQDVVQGLLFLMYNPNLSDPLCGAVCCSSLEEFGRDVEKSIAGGRVGDYLFPVNPRYARLHPAAGEKRDEEGEARGSGKMEKDEKIDGRTEKLEDGERTGLIEEVQEGDEGARTGVNGCKEDIEGEPEAGVYMYMEERYFGIKEYMHEPLDEDDYDNDEENECDEEEETDYSSLYSDVDVLDDEDDSDIVHDEELFELFDKVDDSIVDDENRKNLDSMDSVISWSKMVYGAGIKLHNDKAQVLIEDLSTSGSSSEGACKDTGNAAGSATTRVPQGIQKPTVASRFYSALQTRAFRRWLV